MEKFLKFKENVSLKALGENLTDDRIIILRESKTTGTIQIKTLKKMSAKQIKMAFKPFAITKIYNEFPYPTKYDHFLSMPILRLKRLITAE
jgi:hypothetical protein